MTSPRELLKQVLSPESVKKLVRIRDAVRTAWGNVRYVPFLLRKVLMTCPVCGFNEAWVLPYGRFRTSAGHVTPGHLKFRCAGCAHVHAGWFPDDVDAVGDIYGKYYAPKGEGGAKVMPTFRRECERKILELLLAELKDPGRILDFSCGNNHSLAREFNLSGNDVVACDVNPNYEYDGKVFFRYSPDITFDRPISGIASVDSLEHIQDIRSTWLFFNRNLADGGLMAHSFPTAFRYGPGHYFFRIPFHTCLFSRESLNVWCGKMGFEFLGESPLDYSDVGVVYWFKKTGLPESSGDKFV